MTQEHILVSPLIPACPKPGVKSPAFRPADPGDTRDHVAHPAKAGPTCATNTSTPVPVHGAHITRASVLECGRHYRFSNALHRTRRLQSAKIPHLALVTHTNHPLIFVTHCNN